LEVPVHVPSVVSPIGLQFSSGSINLEPGWIVIQQFSSKYSGTDGELSPDQATPTLVSSVIFGIWAKTFDQIIEETLKDAQRGCKRLRFGQRTN
jgi:hypothetical protein